MYLSELFKTVAFRELDIKKDVDIQHLTNDSRTADATSLFIAASGYSDKVHSYIPQAYSNACRCFVIAAEHVDLIDKYRDAQFFIAENVFESLALLSKVFYKDPSSKLTLIGITGTNGKTTTSTVLYNILMNLGIKTGLIGTIEYRIGKKQVPATNTTPDILTLNQLLYEMTEQGVKVVVMEVSSHALSLGRVLGLEYDLAAFTNLTQDHLDFHHTMQEYLEAKLRLFHLQSRSLKQKKTAIINQDMDSFVKVRDFIRDQEGIVLKTYSIHQSDADYYSEIQSLLPGKSTFLLRGHTVEISMMGHPNVYNFTLVSAILLEMGYQWPQFQHFLSKIQVPGRMESLHNSDPYFSVFIDYAHTPDAMINILESCHNVRLPHARIIIVFGAGGDRDATKRPLMAQAAQAGADILIITSDNPRTEDPEKILQGIVSGLTSGKKEYKVIPDRKQAIQYAIKIAKKDDIIVIAGKGHEDYQIIGKVKHHFSDREEVEQALIQRIADKG